MSTSVTAPRRTRPPARSVRSVGLAALSLAVASVALGAAPALAAPAAPTIIGPTGTSNESPELTWTGSPGATGYEVQVDDAADFSSPDASTATTNTVWIPLEPLTAGEKHVRVRAKDATGWSEWSRSSFAVGTVAGPTLSSPVDEAHLAQPDEPPLLTWEPVPGAKSYTVEVDDERDFVGATSYTTTSTSLVVPDNQSPEVTYHWRVRATLAANILTNVSATRSYTVHALPAPQITSPANDEDVTDVVLDWEPVPGAKHYELQVDDDHDFSSPEKVPAQVLGTRFSPPTTFGNDQYYWRVRAVDADNNPSPWADLSDGDHYEFDRVWRDTPKPVHPSAAARAEVTVTGDFYYEWTPVRNASHYEVWLSTDPNFTFTSRETVQCTTLGTTYTPTGGDCMPTTVGALYYWKVRAFDTPYAGGVEGIFSEAQPFRYGGPNGGMQILSPRTGAEVTVPTVSWDPVETTSFYRVEFFDETGEAVETETTYSTSYTPATLEVDKSTLFRVRVTAVDSLKGAAMATSTSFRLLPPPTEPEPGPAPLTPVVNPPTFDAPHFSWAPLPGAHHYRVEMGATTTAPVVTTDWTFPAATDMSTRFLAEGSYTWRVRAYDKEGLLLGTGPTATSEVLALPPVRGQRLALTGSGLDDGDVCAKSLTTSPTNWCDSVPTTPVLDWSDVPYASDYRVHVSRDGDFTTGTLDDPVPTSNTRWTPDTRYKKAKAFPDSQASTAYYWFIQPCKADGRCGPDPRSTINPASHAFRKASPKVELEAPQVGEEVTTTEVTFTWTDYLETNRATVYGETGETSTQSARSYSLQVATEPTFTTLIDEATVDQTTYTSTGKIYPEGPIYWRVQAIDDHLNRLGWSQTRSFTKLSPTVPLLSPVRGAEVTRSVPFTWRAQPFASSYELQVAANDDANFSPGNLVEKTQGSKRPAWTTGRGFPALAPSTSPYRWRVRLKDPSGNYTRWSEPGSFRVLPQNPDLVSPGVDAVVGPRALTLRWQTTPGAARYRVSYRRAGSTSTTVASTYARAFAPTGLVVGATYDWRVETLDTANKVLGDSGWRSFTVGGPPSATVAPKVEGAGVLGTELRVTAPTWDRVDVDDAYQWLRSGVAIPGATGTTYEVTTDDVDRPLSVRVTGTSAEFGVGTTTSLPVVGLPGQGPEVVTAPVVSGTGAVGTTLASTPATWDRDDVTATYQWLRDGTVISGATGETYPVVAADLDKALTLRVTGTAVGRQPTVTASNAVTVVRGVAPQATTPPTVTGTPKVGQSVGMTPPTWDLTGVSTRREWLRDGEPIAGATATTYAPVADDLGRELSVRVTGDRAGHHTSVVVSSPVVVQPGDAPTARSLPVLSGTGKVGTELTTSVPGWSLTGVSTSVQWLRDGEPITGATATTYAVGADDLGRSISSQVTAVRPGHTPGTTQSVGMTVVLGDPATVRTAAVLRGTPKVGETLTLTAPAWSRTDVTTTWEWLRDGRPIAGAEGTTYELVADDLGARISVRFTGALRGHRDATAASPGLTVLLGDAPTAERAAAPTGTAEVGGTLTAPEVTWSLAGVTQSRQWLRDGQPITGATATTYVVTADDAGRSLSVVTTATLAGHTPGTVTSAAVTVPKPAPPVVTPPPKPTPVASRTTVTAPAKVRSRTAKTRVKVTIKVTATGTTPTGTVTVKVGKKVVGRATLKSGKVVLKLKALARGRHTLTVTYGGSTTVKASKVTKKIRIVKR
ncbi:Ig-like domain repeat protein [Nocardioides daphniae]|uniref:Fibronectin type-III domain-containing protein n=1 Tax=Nocardioides daphniae TaxID=402297 RepID=A0A4P7UAS9_9ACTN|nr:Ig-like domain repeat protein [Nocardioides daphniae]QCC76368.1 hypothetical protein E2C04_02575 [Nocardioides daphniae]GGD07475.1 hypothetical protein GCM10007231_02750 [Nocardioides daphniae]